MSRTDAVDDGRMPRAEVRGMSCMPAVAPGPGER